MVDGVENPYRADRIADALFVGRDVLLSEICGAVRSGRHAVRAVMGGRGMGKSSLARQIQIRLGADALTVIAAGTASQVASRVGGALGVDLAAADPVATLVAAARLRGRVAVVIDEIERLLVDPLGRGLLDNLREAYERADGRLAVIVLGGTAVRDLLVDEASPFLRVARLHALSGLALAEATDLLRLPLDIVIPDDVVAALWMETAGHPWLLQMFMEYAVDGAPAVERVAEHIPGAMRRAELAILSRTAFPIWWENLRERGQGIYRRLVRVGGSVPRARWAATFGNDSEAWLEVLASTGLALLDDDAVIARGTLFQRWVEGNHPEAPEVAVGEDALAALLARVGVDEFERRVVRALANWARATIEFPAAALKHDAQPGSGNPGLHSEAFFQMHAIVTLLQHEEHLTAEPEALSMGVADRSDIKVRSRHDLTRRACVEFKIFGRRDGEVVKQVIGYAMPEDTFAAVVSVDRWRRPLRPEYERGCFDGAPHEAKHDAAPVLHPAFYTVHAREGCGPLRVWHFLVQLRDA